MSRRVVAEFFGTGLANRRRITLFHRTCPLKRWAEVFLFSGHFRQILSTLTRNGRDPPRLQDAEDGIVRFVH
jgi:hypothetical protein